MNPTRLPPFHAPPYPTYVLQLIRISTPPRPPPFSPLAHESQQQQPHGEQNKNSTTMILNSNNPTHAHTRESSHIRMNNVTILHTHET